MLDRNIFLSSVSPFQCFVTTLHPSPPFFFYFHLSLDFFSVLPFCQEFTVTFVSWSFSFSPSSLLLSILSHICSPFPTSPPPNFLSHRDSSHSPPLFYCPSCIDSFSYFHYFPVPEVIRSSSSSVPFSPVQCPFLLSLFLSSLLPLLRPPPPLSSIFGIPASHTFPPHPSPSLVLNIFASNPSPSLLLTLVLPLPSLTPSPSILLSLPEGGGEGGVGGGCGSESGGRCQHKRRLLELGGDGGDQEGWEEEEGEMTQFDSLCPLLCLPLFSLFLLAHPLNFSSITFLFHYSLFLHHPHFPFPPLSFLIISFLFTPFLTRSLLLLILQSLSP